MPNYFFLYEQKSNIHHSIEVSLKILTNKLQEHIQSAIKLPDPTLQLAIVPKFLQTIKIII
jgi:hypothetical protein